jgi:hypothetical protein
MEKEALKQAEVYNYQILYCRFGLSQNLEDMTYHVLELFKFKYQAHHKYFIKTKQGKPLVQILSECEALLEDHIRHYESSIPEFKLMCDSKYDQILERCRVYI